MTYFRSVWAIAEKAPYTTLITATVPTSGAHSCAASGRSVIATRTTP